MAKQEQKAVEKLWRSFNTERDQLSSRSVASKRDAIAYALGFHIPNVARTYHCLQQVESRWGWVDIARQAQQIGILDIGCGTGTMSNTLLASLGEAWNSGSESDRTVRLRQVDGSAAVLNFANESCRWLYQSGEMTGKLDLKSFRGNISDIEVNRYFNDDDDLLFLCLGYLWNELGQNQRARRRILSMIERCANSEKPALVLAVEPANRKEGRNALELRELIRESGLVPVYPCSQQEECPLLGRSRDWCYSEITWTRPPVQKLVDDLLDTSRTVLGASAFVFANGAMMSKFAKKLADESRIVIGRPPPKSPGKKSGTFDYLLCSPSGVEKSRAKSSREPQRKGQIYTGK